LFAILAVTFSIEPLKDVFSLILNKSPAKMNL